MVAGLLPRRGEGSGLFGLAIATLGAAFLVPTAYMTLQQAVTPRPASDGKASRPITVEALQRMPPGELGDETSALRGAYVRAPLDAAAILKLSRAAEAAGEAEAAERLKLLAGDMTPRATAIQGEALAILLKRRDFDAVMGRLDGLIRARPTEARNFFALASEVSSDPEGSRAVARMLATSPPWRPQFFAYLLGQGQPAVAARLMDDLRSSGASVEDGEVRDLIDYHLKKGATDQAYASWLSSLSESEMKDVRRVYDGGFTHPPRGLRFDWTVTPAPGLTFRLFPRNTASSDQTLQLSFQDFSGTISNLSQILRLRPGRYRISGETRFEDFASPGGLVFRLYCLDGTATKPLDETPPLPQSGQWIDFEKVVVIPSENCDNQTLRLESRTRLDNQQITRGLVALDAIRIDSLPPLAP